MNIALHNFRKKDSNLGLCAFVYVYVYKEFFKKHGSIQKCDTAHEDPPKWFSATCTTFHRSQAKEMLPAESRRNFKKKNLSLASLVMPAVLLISGPVEECHLSTETSYYWFRETLNISTDITESGSVQWRLALCLAACWIFVFICMIRGLESIVKVRKGWDCDWTAVFHWPGSH